MWLQKSSSVLLRFMCRTQDGVAPGLSAVPSGKQPSQGPHTPSSQPAVGRARQQTHCVMCESSHGGHLEGLPPCGGQCTWAWPSGCSLRPQPMQLGKKTECARQTDPSPGPPHWPHHFWHPCRQDPAVPLAGHTGHRLRWPRGQCPAHAGVSCAHPSLLSCRHSQEELNSTWPLINFFLLLHKHPCLSDAHCHHARFRQEGGETEAQKGGGSQGVPEWAGRQVRICLCLGPPLSLLCYQPSTPAATCPCSSSPDPQPAPAQVLLCFPFTPLGVHQPTCPRALWTLATPTLSFRPDSHPWGLSREEELTGTWRAGPWAWLPCAGSCLGHQGMRWPVWLTRPPTTSTVPGPARVLCSMHVCMQRHFSHVLLFVTPWTVAYQVPLSAGFSRQEYWSGLPLPPPRDPSDPRIKPESLASPALAGGFFT